MNNYQKGYKNIKGRINNAGDPNTPHSMYNIGKLLDY